MTEELQFDDTVEDEYGKWTQVCEEHSRTLPKHRLDEVPIEGLICGVKGCQKEAIYYYTIREKETKEIKELAELARKAYGISQKDALKWAKDEDATNL